MSLQNIIEAGFENRQTLSADSADIELKDAILEVIEQLDQGKLRVAEKKDGEWIVHQWIKKAVLLYFCTQPNFQSETGVMQYYDKVPLKYTEKTLKDFVEGEVRIIPPTTVRKGCYIAPKVIMLPSFVNMGAYIDSGTLVDTWATVGSCAQIGKNVHLSGGVGIGGVLEPIQANPTIIEDNCFIGARSEIVEGVIVEEHSVISMGVFIGQSTKIYNRLTGEISYGRIPAGSVVVPGNLPSDDGRYSLYCAVIVKQVDEKTRGKVSLNELLRV